MSEAASTSQSKIVGMDRTSVRTGRMHGRQRLPSATATSDEKEAAEVSASLAQHSEAILEPNQVSERPSNDNLKSDR